MRAFTMFVLLLVSVAANAQEIRGTVSGRDDHNHLAPLVGAQVYWLGTNSGTATETDGSFVLRRSPQTNRLVVSMIGYASDTISVRSDADVRVVLNEESESTEDVTVTGNRGTTTLDYLNTRSVQSITSGELQRAACCNLSESFQTNAAIDVSFTDAITGTKQIEMLGLSGIYTQTTLENLPFIRGLTSNVGLTFIPGTWIENINISKGVGSVANGYESITGQIDIDLRKPQKQEEKTLFLNLYGSLDSRLEANANLRTVLSDRLSSMTLMHISTQKQSEDGNGDMFLDQPTFDAYNVLQRFAFSLPGGFEGQAAAHVVHEERHGGTVPDMASTVNAFPMETTVDQVRVFGKTGYVFPGDSYRSVGLQWSIGSYRNTSLIGTHRYDGNELTGYLNLLYQMNEGTIHTLRFGASLLFDQFRETFDATPYRRIERVPGLFAEYTWSPDEFLSIIGGLRVDRHNAYGTMVTPRFHLRYSPEEDWVLRLSAGLGYRTANIFAEHGTVFASARTVSIASSSDYGYGLPQESATNIGFNVTHYFTYDYRDATVSFDVYRTSFSHQIVADLDASPRDVRFVALTAGSFSNSVQAELSMKPLEQLDARVAYRYLDVEQHLAQGWMQQPLTSRHRALVTLSYSTEKEENGGSNTFDATLQWFGSKRIPSTATNPAGIQFADHSPAFALVHAQMSRTFSAGFELYVGSENLLNFRQTNAILDWEHPHSANFDGSLVWGPIMGRTIYAGLRYRI